MSAGVFIPLRRDLRVSDYAWIDEQDAELVLHYRWTLLGGYAIATGRVSRDVPLPDSKPMHRFILGLVRGEGIVHHVNEDPLDNRRSNLLHVADKLEHGAQPHPRRNAMCSQYVFEADLPPHERVLRLAEAAL